nr:aspartate aminotransferase family protein [uncultured Desulfobacter sp.]
MLKDCLPKLVTDLPGPESRKVIEKRGEAIPSSVACGAPYAIDEAQGCMVRDMDGNIVMDWVGGIGVLNVGHCHPEVVQAVEAQIQRYFHPQINTFHYKEYVDLADKLNTIVPGDFKKRTAFFNSGSEAVDNCIKIARKYTKKTDIIAFAGAFHGRTFMSMTLTSGQVFKAAFAPLAPGVHRVEFPNEYRTDASIAKEDIPAYYIEKLKYMFVDYISPDNVAAVIMEPVQGENGFIDPPMAYVKALRALCDEHNILLIADEIQTGYCRTGKMFATDYWAQEGVYPDMVLTAKSLAAGLPLSAITAKEEIMESLAIGEIGGTYGGNPVAIAAALKVLEILERDNFAQKAMDIADACTKAFADWMQTYDIIGTFRVKGAMTSIEFVKDRTTKEPLPEATAMVIKECADNGLIVKSAGSYNQIVRMLMPLVTNKEQLAVGLGIMEDAIAKTAKALG